MSNRLARHLHTAADHVPPANIPPDLFERARSRQRGRIARVAAALAVVLLVSVVYLVRQDSPQGLSAGAGWTGEAIPTQLVVPPHWTATVNQSPPGPAAAIFGGEATTDDWFEGRFAVTSATDDRYRVIDEMPYTPPGFEALLSPDGRYVAHGRTLTALTEKDHDITGIPGDVIAFSPQGDRVVFTTGPDFTEPNTYTTPTVGVFDLASRSVIAEVNVGTGWISPGWTAAVSPDGTRLALQVRDQIWLVRLDRAAAAPYQKTSIVNGRLAGPGAWLPDGRSFMVAEPLAGGGWRPAERDAESGEPVDRPSLPALPEVTYLRLVGWQSPDEAIALVGVPVPGATHMADNYDIAWSPFHSTTTGRVRLVVLTRGMTEARPILETPAGVTELDVAADLAVAGAFRTPRAASFGPPHQAYLILGALLLASLAVATFVAARAFRRRARRKRPQESTLT